MAMVSGISFVTQAQKTGSEYSSAVGARFSDTYYDLVSFSYKKFLNSRGAIELNAGFGSRGYYDYASTTLSAAVAYQWHFDIPVEGLKWFVGGGATIFNTFSKGDRYHGFGLGVFPTGGIDYKFAAIPLNLTADVRPTFLITSPSYYNSVYPNVGFSVRYTIR